MQILKSEALTVQVSDFGAELQVLWKVTNPSHEEIFFQIGAHPAFNYPDYDEAKLERGFLYHCNRVAKEVSLLDF